MIRLINRDNIRACGTLVRAMHADRKRVFVDTLKWDIPHDEVVESDEFDDDYAEYLVVQDTQTGDHVASLRMLRTDRPHLLSEVFARLCEREVPRGPEVREITRLCLSPRRRAGERLMARNLLARAIVEYGLMMGIDRYTAVCEMAFLSQLLSAGWRCDPLGLPQMVNGALVGAVEIGISPETYHMMISSWRCNSPLLNLIQFDTPMAA
jgi:acyl-homoserine lactone synthase